MLSLHRLSVISPVADDVMLLFSNKETLFPEKRETNIDDEGKKTDRDNHIYCEKSNRFYLEKKIIKNRMKMMMMMIWEVI